MNISKFQLIVLGIFIVFIVGGVVAFATYRGSATEEALPQVTLWGTFPAETFNRYVNQINQSLVQPIKVTYVQKSAAQFNTEFISALARGQGPDGILIPADMLLPHVDKIIPVPYSALSQRAYRDRFISEAEIYLEPEGIRAVPFTVDPLIMYWNRDLFDAAGLAAYPRYWDEFPGLIPRLTVKDANGNVRRSAVALGDFANIVNAREIFGTLLLQSGNRVTAVDAEGILSSELRTSAAASPAEALQFFVQFVNPTGPNYTWNRGMPDSKSAFLSGTLATYFGFASELNDIRSKNQNLNFDAALMPQLRTGGVKTTFGRMYGFSIVRSSYNADAMYQVIALLTSPDFLAELGSTMYLPTVRRDVIAQGSNDPYLSIFNEAALVSKTWIDADPAESRRIMSNMVNAITSGSKTLHEAIQDAGDEYDVVLFKAVQ